MQAIILAAGMGRRLGEFTSGNTKCMLEVNGVRLIDRLLRQLREMNITKIVIVVGYKGENLVGYIRENYPDEDIEFVDNPVYDKTNNIYSLWLARDQFRRDETLLIESDLIFEERILQTAVESPYANCALVAKYQTWMDGTMVRIDEEDNIVNFIPKRAFNYGDTEFYYKTVNIYKFSREFINGVYLPFLEAYIKVLGENEYYEQVLRVITLVDKSGIKAVDVGNLRWYEIDDVQDLRIAETIFASPEERLEKLQRSYGGYWRYPGLLDFCYLVNPYFPRRKMIEEMKANFENLLRDYPSGMNVNSLLAAKYFGIRHDYAVVGNGAAELIKSLMERLPGKLGVTMPTFEEYPNRRRPEDMEIFKPQNADFSYTAEDLIDYFSKHKVDNLLIVNPDNPSGNFIDGDGLDRLMEWSRREKLRLIVDESFVDFATDGQRSSLLKNGILEENPHLIVMKSISKSYGVPGLRLGVLATSDSELISFIRRDVSIWNINSFAEFYLQIYGKYENGYKAACEKFREERALFQAELEEIGYLRVVPSQANYFLVEITSRFSSHDLTLRLLKDFNILIKDCSHKKAFPADRQYVRIAVRDRKDNHTLAEALKSL